ncbi:hypothetical protein DFJ73DRAFT_958144 [Zopfochytrium polystomum]|nr:hypothetical protein DFJ73DRAFT_958144 [Zopfochytrium polystomum]
MLDDLRGRRRPAIRTLAQIVRSDAFDEEPYRPPIRKNGEAEKRRLQSFMETNGKPASLTGNGGGAHAASAAPAGHESPEVLDEFEMVQGEIDERRQWLDDMIALGRGDAYRRQIQGEIAERVRRLEQIHRERTAKEQQQQQAAAQAALI